MKNKLIYGLLSSMFIISYIIDDAYGSKPQKIVSVAKVIFESYSDILNGTKNISVISFDVVNNVMKIPNKKKFGSKHKIFEDTFKNQKIQINADELEAELSKKLEIIRYQNISKDDLFKYVLNVTLQGRDLSFKFIIDELSNAISSILKVYKFNLKKYAKFIAIRISKAVSEIAKDPMQPMKVSFVSNEYSQILYRKLQSHRYILPMNQLIRDYILYFIKKSENIESQIILDKFKTTIYDVLERNIYQDLRTKIHIIHINCYNILYNHNILDKLKFYLHTNFKYNATISSFYQTREIMQKILEQMNLDTHEMHIKLLQHSVLHTLLESNFDCSNNNSTFEIFNISTKILHSVENQLNNKDELGKLKTVTEAYNIKYQNFDLILLERKIFQEIFKTKVVVVSNDKNVEEKYSFMRRLHSIIKNYTNTLFNDFELGREIENLFKQVKNIKDEIFIIERKIIQFILNKFLHHFTSNGEIDKLLYPIHENANYECFNHTFTKIHF
ncbi:uncharacterized protein LOC127286433 [Leptopilina boulardi]|uniref:uncharacterized protein LOC127286433 n=1 Tax=Leptopilina boulardi TaxID=63433 RepID=UPI0021F5A6D7|nr:uncharacterized protein LOC127286433 [Leptopilina boulardi]